MLRSLTFSFLCFCCISEASANVNVLIVPKSTSYETNTSTEIKKYLSELEHGKINNLDSNPEDVNHAINAYLNKIQKKASLFFNHDELERYNGTVCKISITTGNTPSSSPIITQVFTIDQLADNDKEPCRKINKNLSSIVTHDSQFQYPRIVKDYGDLSIDMIFNINNK
ncbi:TPA: hypothetical protein ACXP8D_004669 [Klebsiella variicola subsp. variicola]